MKKVLVMIALVAGAVSFSNAQGGGQGGGQRPMGTPEERAQRTIDAQLASFNLTAEQKTKTLALLVKMNKSTDSLMATVPADGDRMAAMQALAPKRQAIAESNEKEFVSWLTPEQKTAYDAALAERKQRNPATTTILGGGFGGGRGGQGGGGQRPAGTPPPNN